MLEKALFKVENKIKSTNAGHIWKWKLFIYFNKVMGARHDKIKEETL